MGTWYSNAAHGVARSQENVVKSINMTEVFMTQHETILDPPQSFWGRFRFVGPSLIITATLVGSGELLATTTFGAKVGFAALWLIIGTCLIKVALQEALGRYTISSGDTTLKAFTRLPGPKNWAIWFWLVVIIATSVQLGAISRVVGEAVKLTLGQSGAEEFIWAPVICLICLVLLYNGKYAVIEKVSTLLVSLFSIATIFTAAEIQLTPNFITSADLIDGFRFQFPEAGVGVALGIVAIVGLSSSELVYYAYWCLEKGYARWTGPDDGSEAWAQRARGWIRVMHVDCILAFVIYTTTTVAFYLLGATILHRQKIDPGEGLDVLEKLSRMYTETLGPWAFYLFIGSALLVLFSTLFVSIASYARLVPDAIFILRGATNVNDSVRRRWVQRSVVVFSILFALMAQVRENPVQLVVIGVIGLALLLPVICFAAVWLRYAKLDPRLRPSWALDLWLWASAILTALMTVFSLWKGVEKYLLGGG